MSLVPVGTKIYSFLDHPFRVVEGTITEHVDRWIPGVTTPPPFRYLCAMHDPLHNRDTVEAFYEVYTTVEQVEQARREIIEFYEGLAKLEMLEKVHANTDPNSQPT